MAVTRADLAALSLNIYHDPRYQMNFLGYVTVSLPEHFESGLYVETYKNTKTGEIVIVARGTDLSSSRSEWDDLRADLRIGLNQIPDQYWDYKNYVNSVRDKYPGASIYLTGHSSAGAYVQLYEADCALHFDKDQRTQLPAVTFGAPGVSGVVSNNWVNELLEFGGMNYLSGCISIENCVRSSDIIAHLTDPYKRLGKTTVFPSCNLSGLDAHSAYNYLETAWTYQTGGATDASRTNNKMNQADEQKLKDAQAVKHEYLLAPDSPAFIDAALNYEDMANGYYLEPNEYGVMWRITASGRIHPDDLFKYQKQQEYYECMHYDAICGAVTPGEGFKWQAHEGMDYLPIANWLNTIKKASSGTDVGWIAAPERMQDVRDNNFWDAATFGGALLKEIGLVKTGDSILGEKTETA